MGLDGWIATCKLLYSIRLANPQKEQLLLQLGCMASDIVDIEYDRVYPSTYILPYYINPGGSLCAIRQSHCLYYSPTSIDVI